MPLSSYQKKGFKRLLELQVNPTHKKTALFLAVPCKKSNNVSTAARVGFEPTTK